MLETSVLDPLFAPSCHLRAGSRGTCGPMGPLTWGSILAKLNRLGGEIFKPVLVWTEAGGQFYRTCLESCGIRQSHSHGYIPPSTETK